MIELNRQKDAWDLNSRELMRLGIDWGRRPVLMLSAALYAPRIRRENISARIRLYFKDGSGDAPLDIDGLSVRTPCPNKAVMMASRRCGRKMSNGAVPITFRDMAHLSSVDRISVAWSLPDDTCVIAEYGVSVEEPKQKSIYAFATYEDADHGRSNSPDVADATASSYDEFAFFEGNGFPCVGGNGRFSGPDTYLYDLLPELLTDGLLPKDASRVEYYRGDVVLTDDAVNFFLLD